MTSLKEVNFGLNQYCGPAVLSVLTGESTDRCAAVISAVSGRSEIKAVSRVHLKEAFKRLKFDVIPQNFVGSTLYGKLHSMCMHDGLYVIFVSHHVVAVEIKENQAFICDNHSKVPLLANASARLTQRVEEVWKVFPHPLPKLVNSFIQLFKINNRIEIVRQNVYENEEDNTRERLGEVRYADQIELAEIMKAFKTLYDSGEFEESWRR